MKMKFRSLKLRENVYLGNNLGNSVVNTISTRSINDDSSNDSSHDIKALVLTCIDFRLIDKAVTYLNSIGYNENYDEFILAGASLGYNTSLSSLNYSGWDKVLENHIDISYSLHKIKEIIALDHMDCGAFKKQLNNGASFEKYHELGKHVENLNTFRSRINTKYTKDDGSPKYNVNLLLMRLNGTVDVNPTYWRFDDSKKLKVPKNNVVVIGNKTLPNSFNSVGTLVEPKSTLLSLKYTLLDKDGKEFTSPSQFVTVKNEGDVWYIQCTSSVSEFGILNLLECRLQLVNSLAYIKLKMIVESTNDADVTFIFEQSDYF